ncbi:transglycosylase SLT domain-containing protein [Nocardioides sp.]|uniref:transglycosylase SLT domain-containing protein n=1 Tax=Nocardioides sp. TaxID=35761 RepID=UPI002B27622D|nr:transglycosylase SLT domain-containing protein [Nocardioides sp.]
MSVAEATSRIAHLQSQLSALAPVGVASAGGSAAAFAASLSRASAAAAAPSTAVGGTTGEQIVNEAERYLGMPYVWGGDDPSEGGLDCSGLVQHVYEQFGIDLPRVSSDQARAGTPVGSLAEARPGDLLAWDSSSRNVGADHIAIYVGDGMMIEAPRTGLDIRLVPVPSTPDYIRRILPDAGATPALSGVGAVGARSAATSPLNESPYGDLFRVAGERYGIDPALLDAVAKQESAYDPRAVSPAGAQGLMQLMPGTADGLGVTDPFDPTQAVDGAARLLRDLLERFGQLDLALAGYNAGPGAVLRYGGVPPYPETQNYVRSIMSDLGRG